MRKRLFPAATREWSRVGWFLSDVRALHRRGPRGGCLRYRWGRRSRLGMTGFGTGHLVLGVVRDLGPPFRRTWASRQTQLPGGGVDVTAAIALLFCGAGSHERIRRAVLQALAPDRDRTHDVLVSAWGHERLQRSAARTPASRKQERTRSRRKLVESPATVEKRERPIAQFSQARSRVFA